MGSFIRSVFRAIQANNRQKEKHRRALDMMARRELRIIFDSEKIINSTKQLTTLRARFEGIAQAISRLHDLEDRFGIKTSPTSIDLKSSFDGMREERFHAFYKEQIRINIEKIQAISNKATANRLLDKSRMLIVDSKSDLHNDEKVNDLISFLNELQEKIDWGKFLLPGVSK